MCYVLSYHVKFIYFHQKKRNVSDVATVIERDEEEYLDLGLDLCEDKLEEYFEIDKPAKRIRIEKEEKVE